MLIVKSSILVIQLKGVEMCIQLNLLVLVISINYLEKALFASTVSTWIQTTISV